MELYLDKITFLNDFFAVTMPDNNTLILNKIDESLKIKGENIDVEVKAINVEIYTTEGDYITCPCVIGLGNDYIKIETKYKEYEGAVLTSDNMKYCTITVYES